MRYKTLPLLGALAFAAPSFAVTVNVTDFVFPDSPAVVVLTGGPAGPSQSAYAGEFYGTYTDGGSTLAASHGTLRANATTEASSTSFMAWCVELNQEFSFGTPYNYSIGSITDHFTPAGLDALSRLFTAAQGFVVDSATSAALQAGIWEIEYEAGTGFNLFGGTFMANLQSPTTATTNAFNTVNGYLANLSGYSASYQFQFLSSGTNQDFLIAVGPIPEPETWALMVAGFGALAWAGRRKAAKRASATA